MVGIRGGGGKGVEVGVKGGNEEVGGVRVVSEGSEKVRG